MRISLQAALIALVLGGIGLTAGGVHLIWWRAALGNSAFFAGEIEHQVAASAQREWWSQVADAETMHRAVATLLDTDRSRATREAALSWSAGQTSFVSEIVHIDADGDALAAVEPREAGQTAHLVPLAGDIALPDSTSAHWVAVDRDPLGGEPAVAYVAPLANGGRLATFVTLARFSSFLSEIAAGRHGGAAVIDAHGAVLARGARDRANRELHDIASLSGDHVAKRPPDARDIAERIQIDHLGERYKVSLSPLHFRGWQLAVILADADFLDEITATTRRVALGLAIAILLTGAGVAALAHIVLATPIRHIVADLALLEHFEFDTIVHRPSRLREIDQLSIAFARMAAGIASFSRFIPVSLVRDLVASGMRAEPGGSEAEITVMFADLAGFTRLTEQLGAAVLPLASSFFEQATGAIEARSGVVDKFIGDAVMALWGAPQADRNAAFNACRAALAIQAATQTITPDGAGTTPLRVRIGLNSGEAIVGNIGSRSRLNYTAIGDTVNLASRLESANKFFGTSILIGEETRVQAGTHIIVREIDRIAVYGRDGGITVYELLGLSSSMTKPAWAAAYERGLAAYRRRAFAEASAELDQCLALRPEDGAALLLAGRCRTFGRSPPSPDWNGVLALEEK